MSAAAPPRLFCFGLGYTARVLAAELRPAGWQIAGTCRGAAAAAALAGAGIAAYRFDGEAPLADAAAALSGTTHLLAGVPPGAAGDPVLLHHAAAIAALAPRLRWVGYLSTTGVYGDRGGGWVDESAVPRPSGDRGRRRCAAEAAWQDLRRRHGLPLDIFRLAGIYGPGRSALDAIRRGTAQRIDKPGQVFSRIHVADIAAVLRAAMARPGPGAIYNVCDDDPAPPHEVVAYAARLLGVPPPPLIPFAEAPLSEMARSFYADNKRVDNAKMKRELAVALRYPSYRAGLAALLAAGA